MEGPRLVLLLLLTQGVHLYKMSRLGVITSDLSRMMQESQILQAAPGQGWRGLTPGTVA